jgi:hypothetical protein
MSNQSINKQQNLEQELADSNVEVLTENKLSIADIKDLTKTIVQFMKYVCTDEMKKLRLTNEKEFEERIEDTFPDLLDGYYGIYKLLLSGQDIGLLFEMLRSLNKVNDGLSDFQKEREKISAIVNEKYVLPKLKNK